MQDTSPRFPYWPPQAGDIFFVSDRTSWLGGMINRVQAYWSKKRGRDGVSEFTHVGIFTGPQEVFETTAHQTMKRLFAPNYAGSHVCVLRWPMMDANRFESGWQAVADQEGKDYPYGRLLAHWFGIAGRTVANAKECSWLTASFLQGAGFPLRHNPNEYDVDLLFDELREYVNRGLVLWVFGGSPRASGLIQGAGYDATIA